ncbi:MAG: aminoacyl-tRNA hydrolase [Pirellulaceae bacterium]
MKLIVGLGNPGRKYDGTRHNVGYAVLAELSRRHGGGRPKGQFQGETVEVRIGDERVLLLTPLTYMNNSGNSVQPARDFYKLENADVLVICDDLNLPLGRLRIRIKGSAGGQKGLASIIGRLGGEDVPRLRIGIGAAPEGWDAADYVLGRFRSEEQQEIDQAVARAADGAECWVRSGIETCMNQYNAS